MNAIRNRESRTTAGATDAPRYAPGPARSVRQLRDYGIVIAFLALFVGLSIGSPVFLTERNLLNLAEQYSQVGIIACGVTLVIIAGGFDLSAGAIYAFAGVVAAKVGLSAGAVPGLAAGVLAGGALGAVNGLALALFRVNSFIGTLASSYVFRGAATVITGGFLVRLSDDNFRALGTDDLFGVSYAIIVFVVVALLCGFTLQRTRFGRYLFAVGGNREAARLSGIRVRWIQGAVFTISGLCAGLAGTLSASQLSSGRADAGAGLELTAIAAVVIGGTSINGGEGAIWRTILGVFFIAILGNGFNVLGIDAFYQLIAQGLIIFGCVALDGWARRDAAK